MEDDQIPVQAVSEWQPMTDIVGLAVLGKTMEECGELIAAMSRCINQGIDEREPTTGKPNKQWLEDEVADVEAMLAHVKTRFDLDLVRVVRRRDRKYVYKGTWFEKLWAQKREASRPY